MLEEIGLFDEDFFLYCEDTDLGLRARWAGWKCLYVADAVVDHHYSHSAGRASALKAYYVERNRLFVIAKNFPAGMLLLAPFVTIARYAWHLRWMLVRRGAAARFREDEGGALLLVWIAIRAHLACFWRCVSPLAQTARNPAHGPYVEYSVSTNCWPRMQSARGIWRNSNDGQTQRFAAHPGARAQ